MRHWTENEIVFLKEHYLRLSLKEISKFLNRSYTSVRKKRYRLRFAPDFAKDVEPLHGLSENEKAYIAGFIDGDGCLGFEITHRQEKPIFAIPVVNIDNTDKEIINWLTEKINLGQWKSQKFYMHHSKDQKRKATYRVSIRGRFRVESFLRAILPHLRVKKDLAFKILEFYRIHPFQAEYTARVWKKVFEARMLVNSGKGFNIKSRERLAKFIKELERKEQNQKSQSIKNPQ